MSDWDYVPLQELRIPGDAAPTEPQTLITGDVPAALSAAFEARVSGTVLTGGIFQYLSDEAYMFKVTGYIDFGMGLVIPQVWYGSYSDSQGLITFGRENPPPSGGLISFGDDNNTALATDHTFTNTTVTVSPTSRLWVQSQDVGFDRIDYVATGSDFVPETWHTISFAAGFSTRAGYMTSSYRRIASPPDSVQLVLNIVASFAPPNGTTVFTLPAGYRPSSTVALTLGGPPGVGGVPQLEIDSAGVARLYGMNSAVATQSTAIIPLNL